MPTGFLNLPAELRLEIYKYLLVSTSEDPIDIFEWSWGDNKELKNAVKLSPNILCTNSKILREASPILYGNNCFSYTIPTFYAALHQFIADIGPVNASQIKHMQIGFPMDDDDICEVSTTIQTYCTGLKSITVSNIMIDYRDKPGDPEYYETALYPAVRYNGNHRGACRRIKSKLKWISTKFKATKSLQKIVIEVFDDSLPLRLYTWQRGETGSWVATRNTQATSGLGGRKKGIRTSLSVRNYF